MSLALITTSQSYATRNIENSTVFIMSRHMSLGKICLGIAKTRIEIIRWKFEHWRKERSAGFMSVRKRNCKLASGAGSLSEVRTNGQYKENERAITEIKSIRKVRETAHSRWNSEQGKTKLKRLWPGLHPHHHQYGNKDLERRSQS
ncbi:uncharacterized protein EAF01_000873 [Botrytis porri]|uniref:uncharacterized protein n=1 Tax=Botrytis porri TaxID=87229 RepID=UPI0018FFDEE6|nr:uncharacterized protein EAF01_000873 [Botrytis porri]KAF7914467.1 hypothetical protein EAF01_000873 [Botrytis porri]